MKVVEEKVVMEEVVEVEDHDDMSVWHYWLAWPGLWSPGDWSDL